MSTPRPAFTKHKLTGSPSWYRLDYPDDVDAAFPLAGYITNELSDPLVAWKKDYDRFVFRLLPRVPLAVRLSALTYGKALRLFLMLALVLSMFSVVAGVGIGYGVRSFLSVPETVVIVTSGGDVLKSRSGGGSGTALSDDCYQRFSMAHGRFIKVCY